MYQAAIFTRAVSNTSAEDTFGVFHDVKPTYRGQLRRLPAWPRLDAISGERDGVLGFLFDRYTIIIFSITSLCELPVYCGAPQI